MAKIDKKGAAKLAQMGGVRKPPMPPAANAAKKFKDPEQIKKMAQQKAKQRIKMFLRILIMLVIAAIVGGIVYFVKFYGRQPKDVLKITIEAAYEDNIEKFKSTFTSDSIAMVDSSENSDDTWKHLIEGITPTGGKRPEIGKADIAGEKNAQTAEVSVKIKDETRIIYMRQEEGKWKVNLNVAINPHRLTLPDNIPAEYIDQFNVTDEPEAWWEEDAEKKAKDAKKNDGFFSRLFSGKLFK